MYQRTVNWIQEVKIWTLTTNFKFLGNVESVWAYASKYIYIYHDLIREQQQGLKFMGSQRINNWANTSLL